MSQFPDHLQRIVDQPHPSFSEGEMTRRRDAFRAAMEARGCRHAIFRGATWAGPGIQWLIRWPVTTEAVLLFSADQRPKLYVQHYNHLPHARELAYECDVEWGGVNTMETALGELERRGALDGPLGVLGSYSMGQHAMLAGRAGELVDMGRDYGRLRWVKSDEELDRLRIGALFSDLGVAALPQGLQLGMTEHQLGDLIERTYVPDGASNLIHFLGLTEMDNPDCCVPRQFTSRRPVAKGDVLFCEISANFWDYGGQVLRTFTIGADPTPLYRDLHDVADAAFEAVCAVLKPGTRPEDIIEASSVIEDGGFTIFDDLVHGYGGGYLPPVLGCKSRMNAPPPDLTLEAGMVLVVQPNVITTDQKAGVQTGEMVMITETGWERMHAYPPGMGRIDP